MGKSDLTIHIREVFGKQILATADHTVPQFLVALWVKKTQPPVIGIAAQRGDLTDEKEHLADPGLRRPGALQERDRMSPNTIRNYRTTFAKLKAYFSSHPERSCIPSTSSGQARSGGPPVAASVRSEAAATLVNKGGLLVVRTEPLAYLADIARQEREQRVAELIQQDVRDPDSAAGAACHPT